ncbi:two-component sensor histidine kinase [Paenibacillus sp. VTT E-133280]|jgi:two-component system sensor histidine kinase YesM|uniref:sensor histidine kinase n=1 Tax=Paenibacillus TaxID=44249 RepID=UPI000BA00BA3|nr:MULTISPECIES: sensor histidine kinase [unclassified Paenibacillus]MDH6372423.1 two-component system sensor histidine kinase YesM [Paenibacillus sp. PastF-3]OZQ65036.1 two-component sensor histidine kinase [Paenibacillus sp. VTT E-133280]OZQ75573.1 two-component sensor histidine kinase [Paenibacillus sp. VTT E-133291]
MFQWMVRLLNDIKIRNKLLLAFLLTTLLPVLLVGGYLTFEMRTMAFQSALEQASINVDRVKKRTEEVIGVSQDIAYRLSNDARLKRLAIRQYVSTYDVVEAYRDYSDMREYLRLYKDISNIRLYTDNATLLNNWELINPSPAIKESEWYQRAQRYDSFVGWEYIEDERDKRNYLSLVRKIELEGSSKIGVLVINVNSQQLASILSQESFDTMIVDDQDNIIAANRKDRTGKKLADVSFDTKLLGQGSGSYEAVVDGEASKIVIEELKPQSSRNALRIISVFSIESIVKEPNQVIKLSITVVAISVLLAFLIIYSFSSLFSRRLLHLSRHINRVSTGDFDTTLKIDGKDEIALLARQFNSMVRSVNDLMYEVQESNAQNRLLEQKQNDIRFKMLASQINPHFLFNALEAIRMEAHMKGQVEIARVVRLLGKMMRSSLEVGRSKVLLSQELEVVRCYLDIQQFRYEERLKYQFTVDPAVETLYMPPLLIQPLVENAVIHGLDNTMEGAFVTVEVIQVGDHAKFTITDNGVGISPIKLEELQNTLERQEEREGERIGLRNVHDRLKLSYGAEYGLTIESKPNVGTVIFFCIPMEDNNL